jgi:hypothetical protein
MNFLKRLVSVFKSTRAPQSPMPQRTLNLQYEILPENAALFAEQFVDIIRNNERVGLNYTIGTLVFVDDFLERFNKKGVPLDKFAETIFVAGCYAGQVMIFNHGGEWIREADANVNNVPLSPLVVRLSNGLIADPLTQAFKRFTKGKSESLMRFYHVFTQTPH